MMNFVDISNWQGNNNLKISEIANEIDAVICKATEGTYYVDPYCDDFIEQAKAHGKLWGFYHFAAQGNPIHEADFFIDNCRNYFGNGIPCLDWESGQSVDWVNKFVRRVHDVTGVWCWIYSWPRSFANGDVEQNCGRWVCEWPSELLYPDFSVDTGVVPECQGLMCAWQFASDGRIGEYYANLDLNRFFGDEIAWKSYAKGSPVEEEPPDEPITNEPPEENNDDEPNEKIIFENEWIKVIAKNTK